MRTSTPMTTALESFLVLEKSLSARIFRQWKRDTDGVINQIIAHVNRGEFDKALDECPGLSMVEAAEKNQRYTEFIGMQATLFGASRLTQGNPRRTRFVNEDQPEAVTLASAAMVEMLGGNGTEDVCRVANKLITEERAAQQEEAYKSADKQVRKDATTGFIRRFTTSVRGNGEAFINLGSSLHTSRLGSWGFTQEATFRGIDQYQVSEQLDSRTCPVCRTMHGRKFSVAPAAAKLTNWLSIKDLNQLKSVAPWPKQDAKSVKNLSQMSNSRVSQNGWDTPPYHPLCRGVLVPAGSLPVKLPVPTPPISEVVPEFARGEVAFEELESMVKANDLGGGFGSQDEWLKQTVNLRNKGKSVSKAVSTEAFNKIDTPVIMRGVSEAKHVAANIGDEFMGVGIYGNGMYYGVASQNGVGFTYGNMNFNGWVYASKMKESAKVIKHSLLVDDHAKFLKQLQSTEASDELFDFFSDTSRYAAWRGFDGILVEGRDYMVVLNKRATVTAKSSLPGSSIADDLVDFTSEVNALEIELKANRAEVKELFTTGVADARAGNITWDELEIKDKVLRARGDDITRQITEISNNVDKRRDWLRLLETEFDFTISGAGI